jgi:hypothetical protein
MDDMKVENYDRQEAEDERNLIDRAHQKVSVVDGRTILK